MRACCGRASQPAPRATLMVVKPVVIRTPLISKGARREPPADTKCPQAAQRNEAKLACYCNSIRNVAKGERS